MHEAHAGAPADVDPPAGGGLSELCSSIARLYSERWGRGPQRCRAYWAGADILLVLLEDGHNPAERTLRAAGHIQEILGGRHALQRILEDDLCRLVEQATGRRVATVLSATRLEPDLSAEVFLLVPAAGGEQA